MFQWKEDTAEICKGHYSNQIGRSARADVDDIGCLQVAEIVATVTSAESSSGTTLIHLTGFSYGNFVTMTLFIRLY